MGKTLDCYSLILYLFILWNEGNQHSVLLDIFFMVDLIVLFLLVAIYSATYGISLNHFILYVDNNNSVF